METSRSTQFYVRKNTKNLIEIVEAYGIGKIRIGFRQYDAAAEKGSRTTGQVDFYMEIREFDLLCHNLLSGNIMARLRKGNKIDPVYKGSARDGKLYSRVLTLTKSNKEEIKSFAIQGRHACDVYYLKLAMGLIEEAQPRENAKASSRDRSSRSSYDRSHDNYGSSEPQGYYAASYYG